MLDAVKKIMLITSPWLLNICPHPVLFKKESEVLCHPPLLGFGLPPCLGVRAYQLMTGVSSRTGGATHPQSYANRGDRLI